MSNFNGFSQEAVQFFASLAMNNDKAWFDAHKKEYETYVKQPAFQFIQSMGARLQDIAPDIQAIPKINQGLFRLNRDVRFSKDKSPYKTHLGIWLWEGKRKRMENSGFYLHLEGDKLLLGVGIYMFPKELMTRYRDAIVDDLMGGRFQKMNETLKKQGIDLKGKHFKKCPRGYDPQHPNAQYLLYNGLHTGEETTIPAAFFSAELVDYCYKIYKKMLPLHVWLRDSVTN